MQTVLIVGAGKGGTALMKIFRETQTMNIVAVVDIEPSAPGLQLAERWGIETAHVWSPYLTDELDIIVEATNDEAVFQQLRDEKAKQTILVPGTVAHLAAQLVEEKEELITQMKEESFRRELIFNASHDGMIAIDAEGKILLFNRSAIKMTGVEERGLIGRAIADVIPVTQLPRILETRVAEVNRELVLPNGKKIVTTRVPLVTSSGTLIGAFAVFKDITDAVELANEITNLKQIQLLLEAIIQSSEEAISVVDEHGRGLMINPAYTRLTGLSEEAVIGKPATTDISEGESVHLKVLETRKPMRGVRMSVGPSKRDVIVNVAPLIVDGKMKGSVGVIHDVSEIQRLTEELKQARQIIRTLEAKYSFADIIGTSDDMRLAIEQAKLGATTPATVLLRGESGTGKELFAHAIHNASDRKFNKFIRVNCAAISETLLESELFGYEDGAFSGARRGGKRGYFEDADKGSIFLDEIGELSFHMQAKLLRVLQEREIVRVGGTKSIPVDVRIIAATHVNLEQAMRDGTFREDLFYRLNKVPIQIPPLRTRKQDIASLCDHLLLKINQDYGRNVQKIADEALQQLQTYDWPGNVRELENILGRALISMRLTETVILAQHLPPLATQGEQRHEATTIVAANETLNHQVEQFEKQVIAAALAGNDGNKTQTAKVLGLSVRTLYYKMERYGLQ